MQLACAALLLQSPLMSGAQAILGPAVATAVPCADVFKNYAKVGDARCRVAIAHGTADEVVLSPIRLGHTKVSRRKKVTSVHGP